MPEISTAQVRAIKARQAQLGMDDDTYRALLDSEFGVRSCKDLDARQAHRLLLHLHGGQAKPRARRPVKNPAAPVVHDGKVVRLPTPRQSALIDALVQEVAWDHADGYPRWRKTCLGLDKVCSRQDASRVIQGLKGLKRGGHARRAGR